MGVNVIALSSWAALNIQRRLELSQHAVCLTTISSGGEERGGSPSDVTPDRTDEVSVTGRVHVAAGVSVQKRCLMVSVCAEDVEDGVFYEDEFLTLKNVEFEGRFFNCPP